ncbi:hypothetical protein [Leuconostoc palmae]|uniref:hypothetical protein n=1 Tax=Leuconostoc palmae TaxID=501487 RepID=UPI001C7DC2CB|nr:hypothetical protein [Leuconostoc palmae]
MATKKEWIEYFELINERQPTDKEIVKAIEEGEIDVKITEKSTVKPSELSADADRVYTNAKGSIGNFFTWVKPLVVHPSQTETSRTLYLWIIYVFATLTSTLTVTTLVRRLLDSTMQSYSKFRAVPEQVATVISNFNSQFFFCILVTFALAYVTAIPGLVLINRNQASIKQTINQYLKWLVPVSLFSLVSLGLSFIVPLPLIDNLSLDNLDTLMKTMTSSFNLVLIVLEFGITTLIIGQQLVIVKAHSKPEKIDLLWLMLLQVVISIIITIIELRVIIIPMFENLGRVFTNVLG